MIVERAFTDAGLILITGYDSIWTNKDTEYLLYVLDTAAGTFRFSEPLKVKGRMLATELTDRGLIYVTTHELNVFDPATGALVTAPVLRGKKPLVTVNDEQQVYASNSDDGSCTGSTRHGRDFQVLASTVRARRARRSARPRPR